MTARSSKGTPKAVPLETGTAGVPERSLLSKKLHCHFPPLLWKESSEIRVRVMLNFESAGSVPHAFLCHMHPFPEIVENQGIKHRPCKRWPRGREENTVWGMLVFSWGGLTQAQVTQGGNELKQNWEPWWVVLRDTNVQGEENGFLKRYLVLSACLNKSTMSCSVWEQVLGTGRHWDPQRSPWEASDLVWTERRCCHCN